jgi:tetratricopeptide (TPR) repeat protein
MKGNGQRFKCITEIIHLSSGRWRDSRGHDSFTSLHLPERIAVMRQLRLAAAMSLPALLLIAGPAYPAGAGAGSGGGGGGGGSDVNGRMSPSSSAPAYDAAAEYRKGMEALQAKNYKDALKAFRNVLTVAPKDANSNYLAGVASAGTGDDKRAESYYAKAVRADGNMVPAHRELALTRLKLGDREGAAKAREALAKKAAGCGTCATAADLKAALDAVDAALSGTPQAALDLPRAFASAEQGDTAYLGAVALINERRYGEAIDSLQAARASFGPHPDVLTYLGFANRKLGRYEDAEGYYRAALAVAPRHRGALEYFGELKVERGDLAGARANLALLDASCAYGCYEAEELRRWIATGARAR